MSWHSLLYYISMICASTDFMATKLGKMGNEGKEFLSAKSHDCLITKLEMLYLHFHQFYGYQTCQNGDLVWEIPIHPVT